MSGRVGTGRCWVWLHFHGRDHNGTCQRHWQDFYFSDGLGFTVCMLSGFLRFHCISMQISDIEDTSIISPRPETISQGLSPSTEGIFAWMCCSYVRGFICDGLASPQPSGHAYSTLSSLSQMFAHASISGERRTLLHIGLLAMKQVSTSVSIEIPAYSRLYLVSEHLQ